MDSADNAELREFDAYLGISRFDHVGVIGKNDDGNVSASADGASTVSAVVYKQEVNVLVIHFKTIQQ
jgi:hypothetical protein